MANNHETTTKFKVDISELKSAMQEAKRAVSVANSEFKAVSSSMDDWSKSSDGLNAKLKQLDTNLKSQKTILANLEKQYEMTVAEMGEGSAAADRLKVAINNQQAAINKTEREISSYEEALEEVSEAEKEAAKTGKTVAEVLDDVGDSAEEAGDGFTTLKGAVATFAGNMMTQLVDGVKNAISAFAGLADETREYRNEMAKLETAFETAGFTSRATEQTYKDLYAVLGDEGQAVEAANMLAKLCDTSQDLSKWTNIATGVYGTFSSSLPIESLTEAANETAKVGAVTGSLADALNWSGVTAEDLGLKLKANTKKNEEWNKAIKEGASSEDLFNMALSECSTEQERQALITNTLNKLYSEAADKYKETNKSVMDANRANSDYADTMAKLGAIIEPVTTALKKGFTEIVNKAMQLVGDVDIDAFVKKIEDGFGFIANEVLPKVKEGFAWIVENKDALIAGLAGIAGGLAAFNVATMIMGLVESFKKFKKAQEGATVAQWALNAAQNANPMVLIASLIAAVVVALVAFIATNEEARAKVVAIWNALKEFVGNAVRAIAKFFTETLPNALDVMMEWFKKLPTKIGEWLTATINKVATWTSNMKAKAVEAASNFVSAVITYIQELPQKIWTWLQNVISKVTSWGSTMATKGRQAAQELVNAVVNKVKELPSSMASIGEDVVRGIWNGIDNMTDWIANKISGFVDDVEGWFKGFFGIASPSKLMAKEVGRWIPEGIAVGVDKNAKSVLSSVKDLTANTVGAARSGMAAGTARTVTATAGAAAGGSVNFYQTINSPKQLNRLDVYRNTKNLLGYAGGVR